MQTTKNKIQQKKGILKLRNINEVIGVLGGIVNAQAISEIETARNKVCNELLKLGHLHFEAAETIEAEKHWRQIVSRCYYSCYSYSRALRLFSTGCHDTSSGDHSKVGDLPDTFQNKAKWSNFLDKLRADRNSADYDHDATKGDLENSVEEIKKETKTFMQLVDKYIKERM